MNDTQLMTREVLRRMEEAALCRHIDDGGEYTGFKGMYNDSMLPRGYASDHGHVYDVTEFEDSKHILVFLDRLMEEESPNVTITSGSFFSMNGRIRKQVVKRLKVLAEKGTVTLYVGKNVSRLFRKTNVQVKKFNRKRDFIPSFIKTEKHFNFTLPHTEAKPIRVDLDSCVFSEDARNKILKYFDGLVKELDEKTFSNRPEKMKRNDATMDRVLLRMAEENLFRHMNEGAEFTGFFGLYNDRMVKERHISEYGHVYDASDYKDSKYLLGFLDGIEKEESPMVTMTSGSFFSMNGRIRKQVVKRLKVLAEKGTVTLYVGKDVSRLFRKTNVKVCPYDRNQHFIPHFIKTEKQFNFVLPHNEKKTIRVCLDSGSFQEDARNRILGYFSGLVEKLEGEMCSSPAVGLHRL